MSTQLRRYTARMGVGVLLGCQSLLAFSASELAGSSWQLSSIQSMDDAQGTTKVADPSQFSLLFGVDGHAVFRLGCNRGRSEYQAKPSQAGASGSLTFGPLAATRAQCPPPALDARVARDLPAVRSYLIKDGKLYLSLFADGGIYEWLQVKAATDQAAAVDKDRTVRKWNFPKGASTRTVRDRLVGRQYIDYQVRAGAGQKMTIALNGSSAVSFNLLPPGSVDVAMVRGELTENRYEGVLPDDGAYTIRVFLDRASARRNATANFALTVSLTGTPLKPLAAQVDALIPGTPFHASATTSCTPAYTETRQCEVFVTRRGNDGTATIELRWDNAKRRILFIKGAPIVADTQSAMSFTRDERGWKVSFDQSEHFDIPAPLVLGG